jgi:hypothetical protein
MMPTLEDIIRMLLSGECTPDQARSWLEAHEIGETSRIHEDRRMFAAMAMQGLLSNPGGPYQASHQSGWHRVNCTQQQVAQECVDMADALITALEDLNPST